MSKFIKEVEALRGFNLLAIHHDEWPQLQFWVSSWKELEWKEYEVVLSNGGKEDDQLESQPPRPVWVRKILAQRGDGYVTEKSDWLGLRFHKEHGGSILVLRPMTQREYNALWE